MRVKAARGITIIVTPATLSIKAVNETVVIVGLGEVGKPLMEIMNGPYQTFGVDINQPVFLSHCDVMHICFPFQDGNFVGHVLDYVNQYSPDLTIINSTVAPGTTRRIAVESGMAVVNSPVRGKHSRMQQEMLHYTKYRSTRQSGRSTRRRAFRESGNENKVARFAGNNRNRQTQ